MVWMKAVMLEGEYRWDGWSGYGFELVGYQPWWWERKRAVKGLRGGGEWGRTGVSVVEVKADGIQWVWGCAPAFSCSHSAWYATGWGRESWRDLCGVAESFCIQICFVLCIASVICHSLTVLIAHCKAYQKWDRWTLRYPSWACSVVDQIMFACKVLTKDNHLHASPAVKLVPVSHIVEKMPL